MIICTLALPPLHLKHHTELLQGVATNNGLWGPGSSSCIISTKVVYKSLMFLHRVNNIEHNIKQNIYNGIEVTLLHLHDTVYENS